MILLLHVVWQYILKQQQQQQQQQQVYNTYIHVHVYTNIKRPSQN